MMDEVRPWRRDVMEIRLQSTEPFLVTHTQRENVFVEESQRRPHGKHCELFFCNPIMTLIAFSDYYRDGGSLYNI